TRTLEYDAYGLVISVTTEAGAAGQPATTRQLRFEYAPVWAKQPDERIYPSQIWSPYTQLKYRPSHWLAYQPAYGVVTNSMDVNGVETVAAYDNLGRLVSTHVVGQTTQTVDYAGRSDGAGGQNGIVVTAKRAGAETRIAKDALGSTIKTTS